MEDGLTILRVVLRPALSGHFHLVFHDVPKSSPVLAGKFYRLKRIQGKGGNSEMIRWARGRRDGICAMCAARRPDIWRRDEMSAQGKEPWRNMPALFHRCPPVDHNCGWSLTVLEKG